VNDPEWWPAYYVDPNPSWGNTKAGQAGSTTDPASPGASGTTGDANAAAGTGAASGASQDKASDSTEKKGPSTGVIAGAIVSTPILS
jgi:hypothetical protein